MSQPVPGKHDNSYAGCIVLTATILGEFAKVIQTSVLCAGAGGNVLIDANNVQMPGDTPQDPTKFHFVVCGDQYRPQPPRQR